jgi:NADH-quinone oxidoreductase subunit E
MYHTRPVGPIHVRVCTTTPCWLCGSDEVVRGAKDELKCDIGESSPDGRFYLREFECLGACANAPVLWVDDDFYEDLDYAKAREILAVLKRGEAPTPGPQNGRKSSMPLGGKTTLLDLDGPQGASEEAGV